MLRWRIVCYNVDDERVHSHHSRSWIENILTWTTLFVCLCVSFTCNVGRSSTNKSWCILQPTKIVFDRVVVVLIHCCLLSNFIFILCFPFPVEMLAHCGWHCHGKEISIRKLFYFEIDKWKWTFFAFLFCFCCQGIDVRLRCGTGIDVGCQRTLDWSCNQCIVAAASRQLCKYFFYEWKISIHIEHLRHLRCWREISSSNLKFCLHFENCVISDLLLQIFLDSISVCSANAFLANS